VALPRDDFKLVEALIFRLLLLDVLPDRGRILRIPVISAAQSGGMSAARSGASRPEQSDAGRSVISHTPAALSSPPASSVATRPST
jgi:hypothetical protein